jgi:hypothetical protein
MQRGEVRLTHLTELAEQLHDLLASVDVGRQMLLVRRTLERTSKQVLHLKAKDLLKLAPAPV